MGVEQTQNFRFGPKQKTIFTDHKKEDNLKNEDNLKTETNSKMKTTSKMTMKNEDDIKNKVGVKNGGCLKLTTIFVKYHIAQPNTIMPLLSLKRVNEGGCL